jgi:hypothetical protein
MSHVRNAAPSNALSAPGLAAVGEPCNGSRTPVHGKTGEPLAAIKNSVAGKRL